MRVPLIMNCFSPPEIGEQPIIQPPLGEAWSGWRWWSPMHALRTHEFYGTPSGCRRPVIGHVHAFDREEGHPMSENHRGVRVMRYRVGRVPTEAQCRRTGDTSLSPRGRTNVGQRPSGPRVLPRCRYPSCGHCNEKTHNVPFVFDMHDLQHTWVRYAAPNPTSERWQAGA